jgi:hypothetical protein
MDFSHRLEEMIGCFTTNTSDVIAALSEKGVDDNAKFRVCETHISLVIVKLERSVYDDANYVDG